MFPSAGNQRKIASNTKKQQSTITLRDSTEVPDLTNSLSVAKTTGLQLHMLLLSQSLHPSSPKSVRPHLLHQVSIKNSSSVERGESPLEYLYCAQHNASNLSPAVRQKKAHVQDSKLFCLFTDMFMKTESRGESKAASSVRLGAISVSQAGMKLQEISRIDST